MSVNVENINENMSLNIENTIISNSETVEKKVIKRIRKKKIDTNVVIIENKNENDVVHADINVVDEPSALNALDGANVVDDNIVLHSHNDIVDDNDTSKTPIAKEEKVHKKRGRKPKGGKIIINNNTQVSDTVHEYNIILHLKCGENDLVNNNFLSSINYDPTIHAVETFQFENSKELNYLIINNENDKDNNNKDNLKNNTFLGGIDFNNNNINNNNIKPSEPEEFDYTKNLWKKIKELTINLHKNNIQDKKSDCFWCTCPFDNPPLYIPKYELNNIYYCYGCFCSPECATAFLFKETIDTSTRFERYHLLNHIYCKIYNYTKNIKPAPDPYYTLNKYYGNLTIQEYRLLLKNERILIIVDKPLSRILPELHEDNDDFINNMKIGSSSSTKFHIKKKTNKGEIASHI